MNLLHAEIDSLFKKYRLYLCQDCGKCTSSCPLALRNKSCSPRLTVHKLITQGFNEAEIIDAVWGCLTCANCFERCPAEVHYSDFIRELRYLLLQRGIEGLCAHHGALQTIMNMMTLPNLKQDRLGWLPADIKYQEQGDVLYFVGCAPYFDAFFQELKVNTRQIHIDALRLLNFFGVEPVLLPNERCCGHDLLWGGDIEGFKRLMELNLAQFKESGVKTIITSCPEGHLTLSRDYPRYTSEFPYTVVHILDFLDQRATEWSADFKPLDLKVTFQDPCRLGRFFQNYELPRRLLGSIPNLKIVEMEHNRSGALCCGNCGWMNCDRYSKSMQVDRLQEALDTKAEILITACPKCQVHLSCAMHDPNVRNDLEIRLMDIVSLLARQIQWVQEDQNPAPRD